MAGGPISITDMPTGNDLTFFQNDELLALQKDGFVGKPLERNLWNTDGEVWYGQMKDGSWVIGLFNRDQAAATRSIDLTRWVLLVLGLHVTFGSMLMKVL